MSILFEDSFKVDYSIYNNLINLLISHKLIDYNCLDRETSLLLAEPLKLINYSFLDNDKQMTAFSSPELYLIINSLLKERIIIVDLFEKMNKERKV